MAAKRKPPALLPSIEPSPSGSGSGHGSGSRREVTSPSGSRTKFQRCRFFPKSQPLPVALSLQIHPHLKGGTSAARERLNQPALLIHAQDAFACCWFSRPIDFGDDSGNPAYWMLQKTAMDTWFLCLRRVSGEVAAYHLKTRNKNFPIKLKKGRVSKEFTWPPTITIRHGE